VFGNPGSGKSHLLTALAQELVVGKERKMHFTKCALLMQDLLAAKRDLRLSREIKRLSRFDGLIIDDLGYLQQSRDEQVGFRMKDGSARILNYERNPN
jgi:DNA replication protein DnaC